MEKLEYDGVVEAWKVNLIVARARRMGFRRDEIPDVQQSMILDVAGFEFDTARSNGAQESTAIQSLIDNHLKKECRANARYRSRVHRLRNQRIAESYAPQPGLALDVRAAVASFSPREQQVCRALVDGCPTNQIARLLGCSWHTADRLIRNIRERFEELELDAYLGV